MNKREEWQCVAGCGACCNLDPSDRPDLEDYLSPEELQHYLSLVGEDGWCINFEHQTRKCRIYEQRPRFCRVQPEIFHQMYDIDVAEFNEFAIDCCREQIEGVYGEESEEMQQYNQEICP
ncbi:YkgJ family cysteine cluster protein [Crocosphaera sp. XPORK-15E]|uniref:YkgJ family cysteine cluster protein n=1 Tax=Crocosphaera sp. XPORK-15E TaxID=3110247 RepID=UPI002B1EEFDC|nr:YkgJ family cysteine cluster protein [Crocosphaera sp. XPORK-15E]MEA5535189.1 YkgJ family cysteine cluster protein [Crocosphaera sp. XPORK-15E]